MIITSCTSLDSKKEIERILEVKLPDCYTEIENPTKRNPESFVVTELLFPEECFEQFTNDIAKLSPSSYCGTTPDVDLTMAFCSENDSTFMSINLHTRRLHFEKMK